MPFAHQHQQLLASRQSLVCILLVPLFLLVHHSGWSSPCAVRFFFVRAPSWLAFSLCRSFPCLLVHRAGCSSPCFLCHCFLFFFVRLAGWSSPRATCFFLFVCAPSRLVSSLRLVRTSPSCWPSDAYWRVLSLRHSLFSFVQQAGVRISTGCWPSGSFWVYSLCATRFFFVRLAGWPSPCSTLFFFAVRANIGP